MMVCGKAAPVVGRVSMDYTTIDLGGVPEAQVGDEVIVLDSDPLSPASVYALAEWAGTIPYEIFCHVGSRVKRVAVEPADAQEKLWAAGDSTSAARSA
jgi:alanine racemase